MNGTRLLVIDDDPAIREIVMRMFAEDGWSVSGAADGEEGLAVLEKESPDIVLLDLKLPGMDGFEVLRRARQFSSVPIVALSGLKSLEERELFLDLGGDDYVTKPFTVDELRFRVRANLRRAKEAGAISRRLPYDDGYLWIDFAAHRVAVAGKGIVLAAREYDLLRELVENAGRVVTPKELLLACWGSEYTRDTGLLYPQISRLRRKIERDPLHPEYVVTVGRVGYRFRG